MVAPLFSIITPVFNPPVNALRECIDSVLSQTFLNWEWCITDDGSSDQEILSLLKEASKNDPRISVQYRNANGGIVAASNDSLSVATGTFVAFLDHDDCLHADALAQVAIEINTYRDVDYLYTDEDKITEKGEHYDVFLKPDWSPERLRGQNYCSHLSVARRELVATVGGLRAGFEGSQDYDLILRITEQARRIVHIPEVLYHWRAIAGSTASSADEKPYAYLAAEKALTEHLARCGIQGSVSTAGWGYHKISRRLTETPLVSIIIPTCGTEKVIFGQLRLLVIELLKSIISKSTYTNIEIVIVADSHTPQAVFDQLATISGTTVKIVQYSKPFNFSEKCNIGFAHSEGEVILLLNDDMEIISPDWLKIMLGHVLETDVGMVGPMLLFEDSRIQSASHSNTPSPHNFRMGHSSGQPGEFGILAVARECSGVTGAAAMIRRDVFNEVGGLSLQFPNCFNDVDLGFKILNAGYRIIWTPHVEILHFESASRENTVTDEETALVQSRWGRLFNFDKYCRLN